MIKKIVVLAILIGILIAGNLLADEGQVGLYLTVLSAYNSEPYQNQLVYATINDVIQDKYTNSSGLAKYGWKASSGIYYIETEINGETYTTTVEKQAGVIANRTWYIQEIKHDPE
ncbi:MAG: hypothetical protein H8D22_06650 [Candidatus Cloacimonetes bacterium]|nr:hypothetical protein [Candidatus Cloacimonadota bacterium]